MGAIRLSLSASLLPTSQGVILRSDLGTFQIAGTDAEKFLALLAPLLDGSRDRAAVQVALGGYAPASVARFLDLLAERGLIEDTEGSLGAEPRRGQVAFFQRWSGGDAAASMARLAAARVLLAGSGAWKETVAAELAAAGIGTVGELDGACREDGWSMLVAAVPPEAAEEAARLTRWAGGAGLRTLWSHLQGTRAILGPLTVPGRTACRICADASGINPPLAGPPPREPQAAIMARHLGHLVALEVLKIISGYASTSLGGRVLVHDLATFTTTLHTLVRLPWCRACGA